MVTIANPPPELRASPAAESCAVEKALAVVGAKWTLIVLHHLMDTPKRFGELQRLVPGIRSEDVTPGGSGVRAQAVARDGSLIDDFRIVDTDNGIHVLNAPSPGATASLAIGRHIAGVAGEKFSLK